MNGFLMNLTLNFTSLPMLIFRLALDSQKRCLQSQMKFLAQATWMLLPQQTRRQVDTRIRLKTLLGHVYVNGKNLSWKKSPCKQYKPSQRRLGCPLPFTKTPWRNIKPFRGFTMVVYEKKYIWKYTNNTFDSNIKLRNYWGEPTRVEFFPICL